MSQIPGYYYDEEKKKYFKIEGSSTASPSAAWSSDAVKRRKIEHQASELARQRDLELSCHIKRHGLREHLVASEILKWETRDDQDWRGGENLKAAAWASGLEAKRELRFEPRQRKSGHLPCLWVGGQEQGLEAAVAYTTIDERDVLGSYVPVDGDGKISFDPDAPPGSGRRPGIWPNLNRLDGCSQMSSISYHQASHRMLLSTRQPNKAFKLIMFSPPLSRETEGVWALDGMPAASLSPPPMYATCINYISFPTEGVFHGMVGTVNKNKPAPREFPNLFCAAATSRGVAFLDTSFNFVGLTPSCKASPADMDILDVDFHKTNPNIIIAAGRQPFVWFQDYRAPREAPCPYIRYESSIAHVRSISENRVLACGPRNTMLMHDIRYFPTSTSPSKKSTTPRPDTGPLLTFPEYRNKAHMQIGFDVSPELNMAAAAQDDGTVKLFSLSTGRKLTCPALDQRGKMDTPIKALTFQTIPGENSPSLFVGEGSWVKKYSFGSLGLDI